MDAARWISTPRRSENIFLIKKNTDRIELLRKQSRLNPGQEGGKIVADPVVVIPDRSRKCSKESGQKTSGGLICQMGRSSHGIVIYSRVGIEGGQQERLQRDPETKGDKVVKATKFRVGE